MEDWSVPGSGSEGEGSEAGDGRTPLDFGGIKIPPMRLLELMQVKFGHDNNKKKRR